MRACDQGCVDPNPDGLLPRHWDTVLGRRASRNLAPGTPLGWDMV